MIINYQLPIYWIFHNFYRASHLFQTNFYDVFLIITYFLVLDPRKFYLFSSDHK